MRAIAATGNAQGRARLFRNVERFGHLTVTAGALLALLVRPRLWARAAVDEAWHQTIHGLPLVLLLAALGGALVSQQTGYQFQGTLPPWIVGSIVAASVVTELAPLFGGLAFVGVVGTRIAAEIAAMRVTQQIEALEVMGRDPIEHLVAPRVFASALVAPLLIAFGLVCGVLAGWGTAVVTTRATTGDFWFGVRHYMRDFPMFYALIKAFVFGLATTLTACHVGLGTQGGSAGVGRSVRIAVIWMIALIIAFNTALVPLLKVIRI